MKPNLVTAITAGVIVAGAALAEPIHLAARAGDVDKVAALLASGVPVEQPGTTNTTYTGVTPLYVAAKFGRLEAVDFLLSKGADPALFTRSYDSNGTPMHVAAQWGRTDVVKRFLELGVDPNLPDAWLGPPLHLALVRGHDEVAALLAENGAVRSVKQDPITGLLTDADPANGQRVFRRCSNCHVSDRPGEASQSTAITLWDIVGRPKAAEAGFDYSDALVSVGGVWDYDALNDFTASPMANVPGTRMNYKGVADRAERADLIAYLRSLSDNPEPLP